MNRDTWKFSFSISQVLAGAQKKLAYHTDRLNWWLGKKDEVMNLIRTEGLEIDESLAVGQISKHYSRGPEVTVRNDLREDLDECISKIREHRELCEVYDHWDLVLAGQNNPTGLLELDFKDYLFFFAHLAHERK